MSSCTLTLSLSAVCCCVSTPYLYAREALADGRGVLVPPSDPAALAAVLRDLLASPERRDAYAAAGAAYGDALHWPRIGRRYLDTFARFALQPDPRFAELPPLVLP